MNGNVIYDGPQFGGRRDGEYEKKFLADGYQSIVYDVPKDFCKTVVPSLKLQSRSTAL